MPTEDEGAFYTAVKPLCPDQYRKLEATTNQMIASVDAGITRLREVYEKVQAPLQQQFVGQKFLTIPFDEEAAASFRRRLSEPPVNRGGFMG